MEYLKSGLSPRISSSGVEKPDMPRPKEGIKDPAFLEKVRNYVAEELLELLTQPGFTREVEMNILGKFVNGEKIPLDVARGVGDRVVRACQDAGLRNEEIEILKREWFITAPDAEK